jgi:hypothetical protein
MSYNWICRGKFLGIFLSFIPSMGFDLGNIVMLDFKVAYYLFLSIFLISIRERIFEFIVLCKINYKIKLQFVKCNFI